MPINVPYKRDIKTFGGGGGGGNSGFALLSEGLDLLNDSIKDKRKRKFFEQLSSKEGPLSDSDYRMAEALVPGWGKGLEDRNFRAQEVAAAENANARTEWQLENDMERKIRDRAGQVFNGLSQIQDPNKRAEAFESYVTQHDQTEEGAEVKKFLMAWVHDRKTGAADLSDERIAAGMYGLETIERTYKRQDDSIANEAQQALLAQQGQNAVNLQKTVNKGSIDVATINTKSAEAVQKIIADSGIEKAQIDAMSPSDREKAYRVVQDAVDNRGLSYEQAVHMAFVADLNPDVAYPQKGPVSVDGIASLDQINQAGNNGQGTPTPADTGTPAPTGQPAPTGTPPISQQGQVGQGFEDKDVFGFAPNADTGTTYPADIAPAPVGQPIGEGFEDSDVFGFAPDGDAKASKGMNVVKALKNLFGDGGSKKPLGGKDVFGVAPNAPAKKKSKYTDAQRQATRDRLASRSKIANKNQVATPKKGKQDEVDTVLNYGEEDAYKASAQDTSYLDSVSAMGRVSRESILKTNSASVNNAIRILIGSKGRIKVEQARKRIEERLKDGSVVMKKLKGLIHFIDKANNKILFTTFVAAKKTR